MTSTLKRELGVIPGPAYVIAAVFFVLIQLCFHVLVWPPHPQGPGLPFRLLFPLIPSTILALIVLMVGYVNRDAGRRGMSRALWTTLVIVIPNAIGFILYFLMRSPLRMSCPSCGSVMAAGANFCANCRYSFNPTCAQCKAAVRDADTFCANCGADLKK
jgi:hypothetical protein